MNTAKTNKIVRTSELSSSNEFWTTNTNKQDDNIMTLAMMLLNALKHIYKIQNRVMSNLLLLGLLPCRATQLLGTPGRHLFFVMWLGWLIARYGSMLYISSAMSGCVWLVAKTQKTTQKWKTHWLLSLLLQHRHVPKTLRHRAHWLQTQRPWRHSRNVRLA